MSNIQDARLRISGRATRRTAAAGDTDSLRAGRDRVFLVLRRTTTERRIPHSDTTSKRTNKLTSSVLPDRNSVRRGADSLGGILRLNALRFACGYNTPSNCVGMELGTRRETRRK